MSLEILQLEELQNLCKKLIVIQEKMQSNDKLIECLNIHYDLSKEDTNEILKVVISKKKVNNEDEKEFEDIKAKVIAYCTITGIKEADKDDKNIDYKKLKSKVAMKLSKLRKDSKTEGNKDLKIDENNSLEEK